MDRDSQKGKLLSWVLGHGASVAVFRVRHYGRPVLFIIRLEQQTTVCTLQAVRQYSRLVQFLHQIELQTTKCRMQAASYAG